METAEVGIVSLAKYLQSIQSVAPLLESTYGNRQNRDFVRYLVGQTPLDLALARSVQ